MSDEVAVWIAYGVVAAVAVAVVAYIVWLYRAFGSRRRGKGT